MTSSAESPKAPTERVITSMALGSVGAQAANIYLRDSSRDSDAPISDVDSRCVGMMLVRNYFIGDGRQHWVLARGEAGITNMGILFTQAVSTLKGNREVTDAEVSGLGLGMLRGYHTIAFRDATLSSRERADVDGRVSTSTLSLAEAMKSRFEDTGDQQRRATYFAEITRLAETVAPLVAERIHRNPESLDAYITTLVRRVADDLALVEGISRASFDTATENRIRLALVVEVERFRQQGERSRAQAPAARIQSQSDRTRTGIPDIHSLESAEL